MPIKELSKERKGEIALIAFLAKKREEGATLKPREIKRQVLNEAKKIGVPPCDAACFAKIVLEKIYNEAIDEINSIFEKDE